MVRLFLHVETYTIITSGVSDEMTDETFAYPFDPTGAATSNAVVGEPQTISPPNFKDFYFVVPKHAPFFRESLKVVHAQSGRELKEGIDFDITHHYKDASLKTAKAVYGSFTLYDKTLAGVLMLSYQTVGGRWTLDTGKIEQILSDASINPRITTWDQITEYPVTFPPIDHEWDVIDLTGMSEVVDKLDEIKEAILLSGEGGLVNHLADFNNPHRVTKDHVGLGLVPNIGLSTVEQATGGIDNASIMTPIRVKQAIDTFAQGSVGVHVDNMNNPHQTTKEQVGLGLVGNYPIADIAQAQAADRNDLYMSPLMTVQTIESVLGFAARAHMVNTNNPHGTTKAQVGLSNVLNYPIATQLQAEQATRNDLYMSPLAVSFEIEALVGALFRAHAADHANPHQVTAAQVGTLTANEINTALSRKLADNGVAFDSNRLEGKTLAEVRELIANTIVAGDTQRLEGKTLAEVIMLAQSGTADNAQKLSGYTLPEIKTDFLASVPDTSSQRALSKALDLSDNSTPLYQMLSEMPILSDVDPNDKTQDRVIIVTGTEAESAAITTVQLVRLSARAGGSMEVVNLTSGNPVSELGYRVNDIRGTVEVWSKGVVGRGRITVTELSKDEGTIPVISSEDEEEPVGLIYVTPVTLWRSDTFNPNSKLDIGATAQNSLKLETKTLAQVVAQAQAGTSANSTKFADRTFTEAAAEILQGSAANALKLDNKTLVQILGDLAGSGNVYNAQRLENTSKADIIAAAQAGTSANSSMLENKTLAQVIAQAQSGTAANAALFGGQAPAFYATDTELENVRSILDAKIDQLRADMEAGFNQATP